MMIKKNLLILFMLLVMVLLIQPAEALSGANVLMVVSDVWCPYSCVPDSEREGFTLELLRAIFEPKGISVVYKVLPYEEAFREARAGKYGAMLNSGSKELEGWVVPEEPSSVARFRAFVKTESQWRYSGTESLVGRKVGVVQGYRYDQGGTLDTWIANNPQWVVAESGGDALERLMDKLAVGTVDVVIEDVLVFQFLSGQRKLESSFQEAGTINELPLYIGFSPASKESGRYADLFTAGIREMKRGRILEGILGRYGMPVLNR